ncbi:MAG TPA: DUF3108 domain-containing protein, partial [Pyrinomonadaceae bacterium]|nr:DUF3108 domain-containing protein [Pyrinomonadaceae bacterium]
VFADPDSGMPLYVSAVQHTSGLPQETVSNYLTLPAQGYDLVTLIYKIRQNGGNGALSLYEGGKLYGVTMQIVGTEKVKTGAGEFDTSVVAVQSDFFTEHGLKDVRINLSNDEFKIPVELRFKTAKGEFDAVAASVTVAEPETAATPVAIQTPLPSPMPKPIVTPMPYVENQPLAPELAFQLGESLEYRISAGGQPVGNFKIEAKERKEMDGLDTLLLQARATKSEPQNRAFAVNDVISAQVSPETLAPKRSELRFSGNFKTYNQIAQFDSATGSITFNGTSVIDAPIGTHSILSLFYAVRSFNLKPSRDSKNPVNDTRVAVFWENQPYIFTLRPSAPEIIDLRGQKVSAQLISISTGNPTLDLLNIKIWLGNDGSRVPLRFAIGNYEGELVSETASSR